MQISKSFVIDADIVKAYDTARNSFLALGYSEQSAIRPTLLVMKKRGSIGESVPAESPDYRIVLRVSFNPLGDLQIYAAALLTVRFEYDIKTSEENPPVNIRIAVEREVEKLKKHLTNAVRQSPKIVSATPSPPISSSELHIASSAKSDAKIQAKLIQHSNELTNGERVVFGLQITNIGKEEVVITKIESILPINFQVVSKPDDCSFEDAHLILKEEKLEPSETHEIRLTVKPFKSGSYEIKPKISYRDQSGHQLFYEPEPQVINISSIILPNRIKSGYTELDDLLCGGIPEKYAVILTSPSSDERDLLIKRFLQAGAKTGQTTFYITEDPGTAKNLPEEFPTSFYLFLCNSRAEAMAPNLPNVFKMKGVENLTEIDISLVKAFRNLDMTQNTPKRVLIEIVSDVLLQHHAVTTRKWLSGLLADLKSKGFTILAVINPFMHPSEEVQAILGLFEGELRISEKETNKGLEKTLRIRKMYNQQYLENELVLTKEKLSLRSN